MATIQTWHQALVVGVLFGLPASIAPLAAPARAEESVPAALGDYVARPENVYSWELKAKRPLDQGLVYDVALTSQTWQGIVWKHVLHVHEPKQVRHPRHVLLFVSGGRNDRQPGRDGVEMGLQLARLTGARVATLYQVPNQPLLGGRSEDDLISETWLRYLETGDESWPLLLPMVKSAVKAMDAVEALAQSQWNGAVAGFVITGASKRGWTSWLTPVADQRIIATAPIVIDVLNFKPQMQHQLDTWGKYSEQISDYTSKGLVKQGDETPREAQLRRMMDPYTYRTQLTLPKLLINGTNDRYWVVDAMKFYWYDLVGPKYVLHVPNAGHGLDGGQELALSTLAAFFRHVASGIPLPSLEWDFTDEPDSVVLTVKSANEPRAARLWTASSPTKDFREAKWRPRPLEDRQGVYAGRVAKPKQGHVALFGELQFELEGLPYSLSTLVLRH